MSQSYFEYGSEDERAAIAAEAYRFEREECFWANVAPPNERGCRLWTKCLYDARSGYGGAQWLGKHRRAHRVAYALTYGSIPRGMFVCHKCDVPLCCNPDHLFAGTQFDNMRDMVRKGRNAKHPYQRGETNAYAKLTEGQIREIRACRARGLTFGQIGKKFSIRTSHAYNIVNRIQWGHVG